MSAAPISPSPAPSPPITPRCSNRACRPTSIADLRAAGDQAFGVLRTAADALVGLLPAGKRPPALMMSLHVWSMAHGIASLFGRGDSGRRSLPMSAEELLESEMLIYLQGLGFPQK